MHEILTTLWREGLSPSERFVSKDSEYEHLTQLRRKLLDGFLGALSDEERKTFEKIDDLDSEMQAFSEEDSFITGFQLGARLKLEALSEYRGQFDR